MWTEQGLLSLPVTSILTGVSKSGWMDVALQMSACDTKRGNSDYFLDIAFCELELH